MPELPEVETVKRTLKPLIVNKTIKAIDIYYDRIIEDDQKLFCQKVINQTIRDIDRYGKYLIFKLDDVAFISHLRMEGKYRYCLSDEEISKHDHVVFKLDDGHDLRYNDTRKFGRMKLVSLQHYLEQAPLNKLGPEPFFIDEEKLYQQLKKKNQPIKHVLLDQSVICGIGNIYANEICFAMKISPYAKACQLTKKRVHELKEVSISILNRAIEQGGTTIHSFSANGIDGLFQVQLQVHGQKVCKECGHKIVKEMLKGRGTYYCPHCQNAKK